MCSRHSLTAPPEPVRAYFGYGDTPKFPARFTSPRRKLSPWSSATRRGSTASDVRRALLPSFVKDPKRFPTS